MAEYSMRILTIKAFPPVEMQMGGAKECFRNACRAAGLHYSITERMIKLVSTAVSSFPFHDAPNSLDDKTRVSCPVADRHCMPSPLCATLQVQSPSTSTSAINANRDLSAKLKDGAAYHYKVRGYSACPHW
jgi:hypothetical protein